MVCHKLLRCDAKWLEYYLQNTIIFSLNYIDWKWARLKEGVRGKQVTACSGPVELFRFFCPFHIQVFKNFVKTHLKVGKDTLLLMKGDQRLIRVKIQLVTQVEEQRGSDREITQCWAEYSPLLPAFSSDFFSYSFMLYIKRQPFHLQWTLLLVISFVSCLPVSPLPQSKTCPPPPLFSPGSALFQPQMPETWWIPSLFMFVHQFTQVIQEK